MNSRDKGKRGELEFAHKLQEYGYNTRRGQQFSGKNGDADVVGLHGIHLEVKRVEKLNIEAAMEQSVRDARQGEMPIVAHRKNGKPWLITMELDDFMSLYKWSDWENARFCARCGARLYDEAEYCEVCEGDLFG